MLTDTVFPDEMTSDSEIERGEPMTGCSFPRAY